MRTIVLGNWKGGVGKTTVSTNLACAFVREFPELRVLFIDADKQGNASSRFCADFSKPNLTTILVDGCSIREAIQHTQYDHIDLIASDPSLLEANLSVLKEQDRRQDNILELAMPILLLYMLYQFLAVLMLKSVYLLLQIVYLFHLFLPVKFFLHLKVFL